MADTNLGEHAFAEDAAAATPDTQPMDLEAKRAELDRLRAEIEAAEAGMPGLAELERIAAETVEKIPIRIGDDPEF